MNKNPVLRDFIQILTKYMDKFGLYSMDISDLAGSSRDVIINLENSSTGLTLKTIAGIAKSFGLKYYEFCNPNIPLPEIKDLPEKTIAKINWRKKVGPPQNNKYNKLNLKALVLEGLSKIANRERFLSSEVFEILKEDMKALLISPTRITGLFSGDLSEYVEKTGEKKKVEGKRGRQEEYYRLIKNIN